MVEKRRLEESCGSRSLVVCGATDLSISMGMVVTSDEFWAARESRKAAGILARSVEQAERCRKLGYTVIAIGSDRGLLAKGSGSRAAVMKET